MALYLLCISLAIKEIPPKKKFSTKITFLSFTLSKISIFPFFIINKQFPISPCSKISIPFSISYSGIISVINIVSYSLILFLITTLLKILLKISSLTLIAFSFSFSFCLFKLFSILFTEDEFTLTNFDSSFLLFSSILFSVFSKFLLIKVFKFVFIFVLALEISLTNLFFFF